MDVDHSGEPVSGVGHPGPTWQRELLDALRDERGGASAFMNMLGRAQLTDEQRVLIELLVSLGNAHEAETLSVPDPADDEADMDEADMKETAGDSGVDRLEVRPIERELDDLREVNDTLAAALGACPLCWGGQDDCPGCGGSGSPGSTLPDERLFDDLVGPAVVMMRAARNGDRSIGSPPMPASRNGGGGDRGIVWQSEIDANGGGGEA
jgi:hypothetical protein